MAILGIICIIAALLYLNYISQPHLSDYISALLGIILGIMCILIKHEPKSIPLRTEELILNDSTKIIITDSASNIKSIQVIKLKK